MESVIGQNFQVSCIAPLWFDDSDGTYVYMIVFSPSGMASFPCRPVPSLVACRIAAWVRALEQGYNRHNIMSVAGSAQGYKSQLPI